MEKDNNITDLTLARMAKDGAEEAGRKKEEGEDKIPSFGSRKEKLIPISQTLIILHRTCTTCGTVFNTPNKNKLVRFKHDKYKQITKPGERETLYDELPKEIVIREDNIKHCQFCWEGELKAL